MVKPLPSKGRYAGTRSGVPSSCGNDSSHPGEESGNGEAEDEAADMREKR
jgi:hypothetical protein